MKIKNPNIESVTLVAKHLGELREQVVFIGGCATGLLITDPVAPAVRPTLDVDIIVEIATRKEYYKLSENLKSKGFVEDDTATILCRWKINDIIVDVMPTSSDILGFSNRWYKQSIDHSVKMTLAKNNLIRLISSPYFIATKFEAFKGRGKKDFIASSDLEDIIAVIDGRKELITEIREGGADLKSYLGKQCRYLLKSQKFLQHIGGFVPSDPGSQQRIPLLVHRLEEITSLG